MYRHLLTCPVVSHDRLTQFLRYSSSDDDDDEYDDEEYDDSESVVLAS